MASFDPSVISQIPTLAGNPMQSVQQAYQLKDLANQEQLDTLKLNQAKQGVSDAAKAKKILSGYDLSDPTQLMKASEALNKAGQADRAMDLLKESQSQTKAKYEISEAHIKILQATSDFIGPNAIAIKQTLAKNPAMARAQYADLMGQILPQLPPELAASIPAQPPKDDAQFGQLLDKAISGSAQARQALTLHLGERKQDTAEKREEAYERFGQANVEDKAARRAALQEGTIPDDDAQFMAKQYLAGDKSILQNLGRGAQGSKNILKLRQAITAEAKEQGLSPEQVAGRLAEYNATVAEERKIGNIAGGVEFASSELNKFIPLALKSSAAVPRGKFVPFNKLLQAGESSISDPDLKRLYVNTQGVLNAYDVLAARGGSDTAKREHNRQMLMTADSQESYKAALDAMKAELDVAKEAGAEAKANVAADVGGKPKSKALTYDPASGTFK